MKAKLAVMVVGFITLGNLKAMEEAGLCKRIAWLPTEKDLQRICAKELSNEIEPERYSRVAEAIIKTILSEKRREYWVALGQAICEKRRLSGKELVDFVYYFGGMAERLEPENERLLEQSAVSVWLDVRTRFSKNLDLVKWGEVFCIFLVQILPQYWEIVSDADMVRVYVDVLAQDLFQEHTSKRFCAVM